MLDNLKKIALGLFLIALAGLLLVPAKAAETGLSLDVDIDDPYAPGDIVQAEIEIENTVTEDISDIEVTVYVIDDSGDKVTDKELYSFGRTQLHAGRSNSKDIVVNVTLPSDLEEDTYTLVVEAEGRGEDSREHFESEVEVAFEVEKEDFAVKITNVELSPEVPVLGDSLDMAITVVNTGNEAQDSVVVKATISELGVSRSIRLLDTLNEGNEYRAFFSLPLPERAEDGIYTLVINAYTEDAGDIYTKDISVSGAVVSELGEVAQSDVISMQGAVQTIEAGETAKFGFEISNNEKTAMVYSLSATQADWADIQVSPSELVVAPGESQAITATVNVADDAKGLNSANIYLRDSSGSIVGTIGLNLVVEESSARPAGSGSVLFSVLVAVLLVLIVIFVLKEQQEPEKKAGSSRIYY